MAREALSTACCLGVFYDIVAQIISVLDVATDVIVCAGFYEKQRMEFFGISLCIILLALIAYTTAFTWKNARGSERQVVCFWLCLLPFSPMLPFIFYFTDSNDTQLAKYITARALKWFDFQILFDRNHESTDVSALRLFMEKKIAKHFGFIIESLVEGMCFVFITF